MSSIHKNNIELSIVCRIVFEHYRDNTVNYGVEQGAHHEDLGSFHLSQLAIWDYNGDNCKDSPSLIALMNTNSDASLAIFGFHGIKWGLQNHNYGWCRPDFKVLICISDSRLTRKSFQWPLTIQGLIAAPIK